MLDRPSKGWEGHAKAFASSLLDAEKSGPDFLTSFSGNTDPRRYAVYKNNVTVSLIRAMESNFPAIQKLVGDEFFSALARLFVERHPPRSRILSRYGAAFPEFLDAFEPLAEYPYLGDVARLEQYWREAFHEADADPVSTEQLATVAPEDVAALRFTAHPAARLLHSRYAAGSILAANRQVADYPPFDPAMSECVLITRPSLECVLRILSPADGAFVTSLLAGETLQEAAQNALATGNGFDFASGLSVILEAGVFSEFSIN
jgi:hypothetical protein